MGRLDLIPGWFGCLVSGMAYIHARNIHHRDVKPQNILYMNQRVLFHDFGIAGEFEEQTQTGNTAVTGTRNYWAPELDEEARPGHRADIFSLGVIFLELLSVCLNPKLLQSLWWRRPYSKNLDEVNKWIYYLDVEPVEAEWYSTMVFISRYIVHTYKGDRPYAHDLVACWSFSPYTWVPSISCTCLWQESLNGIFLRMPGR